MTDYLIPIQPSTTPTANSIPLGMSETKNMSIYEMISKGIPRKRGNKSIDAPSKRCHIQGLSAELISMIGQCTTATTPDMAPSSTLNQCPPLNLLCVNRDMHSITTDWYYRTTHFAFSSPHGQHYVSKRHRYTNRPQTLPLERWLTGLGHISASPIPLIRHLNLRMHASEIVFLFAPEPARRLLNLPDALFPKWLFMRNVLQQLRLATFSLDIIGTHTCAKACTSDIDPAKQFVDLRWMDKAVRETMAASGQITITCGGGLPILSDADRAVVAAQSWDALQSDTFGYHRHNVWDVDQVHLYEQSVLEDRAGKWEHELYPHRNLHWKVPVTKPRLTRRELEMMASNRPEIEVNLSDFGIASLMA